MVLPLLSLSFGPQYLGLYFKSLDQGLAHFFSKGERINILGLAASKASVTTSQLSYCNTKAAIKNS